MFDIRFTAAEPELQEDGWLGLWGVTELGNYQERFLAPVETWSREAYERQWLEAAARLLGPEARSAFFTAAFEFWWVMWRKGERVFVHEEVFTPERLVGVSDFTRAPYHVIGEQVTHTEDGEQISEWEIDAAAVREFLARRGGIYIPA